MPRTGLIRNVSAGTAAWFVPLVVTFVTRCLECPRDGCGLDHLLPFAIDALACPHCGGRLRLIATLHDPAVIRKILAYLGPSQSGQSPGPPRRRPAPLRPDLILEDVAGAVVPAPRGVIRADPAGALAVHLPVDGGGVLP